jgi:hypothetical protein
MTPFTSRDLEVLEKVREKIFNNAVKVYDKLGELETKVLIREENRRKAGIYIIYNKLNGKFFVGSAITNRIFTHFRNHCFHGTGSPITKRAISHHGVENFYFIIYEYFPGIILKDNFQPENLKLLARVKTLIHELHPPYNELLNPRLSPTSCKAIALFKLNGEFIGDYPSIRSLCKEYG